MQNLENQNIDIPMVTENTITYKVEEINEMLNYINSFSFIGFENANKMARIFQILNNPVKKDQNK